jgi:putative metalloprotease
MKGRKFFPAFWVFSAWCVLSLLLSLSPALCGEAGASVSEGEVRAAWSDVCRIAGMEPLPLSIEDNQVPTAWDTAGKSVTVTTGLMKILQREEEIFGVLSHEAGHAKLGHYDKRVGNAVGVNILALLLGKAVGSSALGEVAVGVGANLATAGFSREQEVAADDYAVDTAFKGGKDPTGIYTSLERLALYGGKTEPNGFNSHPPDDRRLKHVKDRILAVSPDIVIPEVKKD